MLAGLTTILVFACAPSAIRVAEIETIEVGERRYYVEKSKGKTLRLDANTCFFDGSGLVCKGKGPEVAEGDVLNGGKSFDTIAGITNENQVSWFVHVPVAGECKASVDTNGDRGGQSELVLLVGNRRLPVGSNGATLRFDHAGVHRVQLTSELGSAQGIRGLTLSGRVVEGASVLRTRWRPSAAHAKFDASSFESGAHVWIMEMDATPGVAGFYSPMTTPFGYYGPSWTAEGIPKGMNFSMWSFGRGKEEPPIEQLSHLLAVGHPTARFDGFGHEGTGVKLRGWNPFDAWRGPSCVLALRFESGETYDTYSGYLFDEVSKTWKLYCAGRKYVPPKKARQRSTKSETLRPGSFVEVPGPPQRQRTGHIVREMRYRGFVLDDQRTPHAIDRMSGRTKAPVGNQGRGATSDGRFRLWMGGMEQFVESPAQTLETAPRAESFEWMKPEKLEALYTWPTTIHVQSAKLEKGVLHVRCDIEGLGTITKAQLFVGENEGLTLAGRWDQALDLSDLSNGVTTHQVAVSGTPQFARILVENEHGKFWSMETTPISAE